MSRLKRKIKYGTRFGRLVVLNETEPKSDRRYYMCKCDCGLEKEIRLDRLTNNGSKSCGCLQKEKARTGGSNLIRERFGKLLVIEKTDKRKNPRSIVWKCKCDCGNITEVDTKSLKTGNTKSCGCMLDKVLRSQGYKNKREKNGAWKGGITSKQKLIRNSKTMVKWRKNVFDKDGYTCQKCSSKGTELHAHHINNFSSIYEEDDTILFDINNGITFCANCHKNFHIKYGKKENNIMQVKDFINKYPSVTGN